MQVRALDDLLIPRQIHARLEVCRTRMHAVNDTKNPVDKELRMRLFGDALIDAGGNIAEAQRVIQDVLQVRGAECLRGVGR